MNKKDDESALKRRFVQNKPEKEGGITNPKIVPSQRLETTGMVDSRRIGVINDLSWRLGVRNPSNNFRSNTNNVPRRVIRNRMILALVGLLLIQLLRVWYG